MLYFVWRKTFLVRFVWMPNEGQTTGAPANPVKSWWPRSERLALETWVPTIPPSRKQQQNSLLLLLMPTSKAPQVVAKQVHSFWHSVKQLLYNNMSKTVYLTTGWLKRHLVPSQGTITSQSWHPWCRHDEDQFFPNKITLVAIGSKVNLGINVFLNATILAASSIERHGRLCERRPEKRFVSCSYRM